MFFLLFEIRTVRSGWTLLHAMRARNGNLDMIIRYELLWFLWFVALSVCVCLWVVKLFLEYFAFLRAFLRHVPGGCEQFVLFGAIRDRRKKACVCVSVSQ